MQAAQRAIQGVNSKCEVKLVEFDFTETTDHAVEWY